ncbi:teneurin transmembrane protein 4 [Phyllostomus discolor]|uniref:Teneurin transmembrane protein 4 n=1 Tax=Phyllostomus discolor TaxID=89673 RepID=A0A834E3S6_9CHIR|nr:teneurin transmembrane protein 4 [Phyllostomus discolor]
MRRENRERLTRASQEGCMEEVCMGFAGYLGPHFSAWPKDQEQAPSSQCCVFAMTSGERPVRKGQGHLATSLSCTCVLCFNRKDPAPPSRIGWPTDTADSSGRAAMEPAPEHSALSAARTLFVDVEECGPEAMDVKERKPYRSLTRRRDAERRYTGSSADSEEGKAPQKSYSSSETLKAYDQDARLAYGSRIKDMVPQEAEEFCRTGANFSLRELGLGEVTPPHGTLYRTDIGLPHCGYSMGASSDADVEADTVLSPEHPVRLWGRSTRSGRSSCLSSRANSNLTLTDTEHENTETGAPLHCSSASSTPIEQSPSPPPSPPANESQRRLLGNGVAQPTPDSDSEEEFVPNSFLVKSGSASLGVAANAPSPVISMSSL